MDLLRLLLGVVGLLYVTPVFGAQLVTDTVYLSDGSSINIAANAYGSNVLRTFCYPSKSRSLLSVFETVELLLSINNDDYSQYDGRTPEEVLQHYNEKRSLFSLTLFSQKQQQIYLSPFEQQCIGIASKHPYTVRLEHTQLDMARVFLMFIGLVIIWSAGGLATNSVFYYLTGIVVGICASLLVLIALASKLFPRRPMMYGVLVGGWTIGLYIIKQLVNNIQIILVTYRDYVLWYLAITGMVSFLICYRIGPPKNPRSQNIIMWVLQTIGAVIVYLSSWHSSICGVVLVINLVAYYFPESQLKYLRSFYKRRFPPKRRWLTQEEYYKASVAATCRSLGELREHVNSTECHQWKMISALRDPVRFAGFANGAPHLYDEEIEDYSRTIDESMIGTDEEQAEDIISCTMYYRPIEARTGHRRQNNHRQPAADYSMRRPLPSNRHHNREESDVNVDDDDDDDDNDNDEFLDQE